LRFSINDLNKKIFSVNDVISLDNEEVENNVSKTKNSNLNNAHENTIIPIYGPNELIIIKS
jgi:hypothetical protein